VGQNRFSVVAKDEWWDWRFACLLEMTGKMPVPLDNPPAQKMGIALRSQ